MDYQLEPCKIDGISDARLNAFPFNTTNGKLVEYLCLDTLWHPASEEPKTFKRIIAKCHSDRVKYEDMMFIGTISWNEKVKNKGIICWLYINDLLEGGK